ncbi:Membrane-anchored ribosome-binding protein, inhibits growth in stationary phase, ElaB/YqjD/DUF883 family [Enhydrobacter aerosaccus]|uniref:Membrane-anchored ribosome-binding protein, inhibits growth in stationary phase, ElaB/YqjD/DUF883 family n=1 Tax=Enhydrobacter aerosaccus TaxID=225324 RepID=A0A1T4R083_9HYPH|nr:hypothetical protein [Enhydrobacter aerosaccus]SKA09390.1 Membrane-anchored ribosome-binding protein, inhibits growth in stationary phase, ElaB/YqjD/DUF883 family [Enhydrobacter aerosaccus]
MADATPRSAQADATTFDYADFKDRLKELAAVLERMVAAESADALKAGCDEARKLLAEADAAVEDLSRRTDAMKAAALAGRSHLEERIRAQPLFAVGIAAAAGFLLASLLQRGRS